MVQIWYTETLSGGDAISRLVNFKLLACWEQIVTLEGSADFFKLNVFEKFFQEYKLHVKQFGSISGMKFSNVLRKILDISCVPSAGRVFTCLAKRMS